MSKRAEQFVRMFKREYQKRFDVVSQSNTQKEKGTLNMDKKFWSFVILSFIVGLYIGNRYGEGKSRYTIVTGSPPAICWIIDTRTGHLYCKQGSSDIDFGTPDTWSNDKKTERK
jgi:hypothetical protein